MEKPQVQPSASMHETQRKSPFGGYMLFMGAGFLFGFVLIKSEVFSWYRIQEMFRFQSFHMFGVIGSAIFTGMVTTWTIRRLKVKTRDGEPIVIARKEYHTGTWAGGLLFGTGWALTGACPGPIYAQIGLGFGASVILLISALSGTFVYGVLRSRLPH
jgi:uncharacterized protein